MNLVLLTRPAPNVDRYGIDSKYSNSSLLFKRVGLTSSTLRSFIARFSLQLCATPIWINVLFVLYWRKEHWFGCSLYRAISVFVPLRIPDSEALFF